MWEVHPRGGTAPASSLRKPRAQPAPHWSSLEQPASLPSHGGSQLVPHPALQDRWGRGWTPIVCHPVYPHWAPIAQKEPGSASAPMAHISATAPLFPSSGKQPPSPDSLPVLTLLCGGDPERMGAVGTELGCSRTLLLRPLPAPPCPEFLVWRL